MREAPPSNAPQHIADSKRAQLEDIAKETLEYYRTQAERIAMFLAFDDASESDYDRAIGQAIRIRKAVKLCDSHIRAMERVPVVRHRKADPVVEKEVKPAAKKQSKKAPSKKAE